MSANQPENSAKIRDAGTIQPQPFYCRSANRSLANDYGEIFVPREVIMPRIAPWMVKRHDSPSCRVGPLNGSEFEIIAALARRCQVIEFV